MKGGNQALKVYFPIADAIVTLFGTNRCEVAIHDLTDPGHSIVYLKGSLTGRHIGGPVTEVLLQKLKEAEEQIIDSSFYRTKNHSDKTFRSSTTFLRDTEGEIIGCFCINYDVTELEAVSKVIKNLLGDEDNLPETPKRYHDNSSNLIYTMYEETLEELGLDKDSELTKEHRIKLVQSLYEKGAFAVQKSVVLVAEYIGVSRITVYNYLKELGWKGQI